MIQIKRSLKQLCQVVFVGLAVGILWWQGLPVNSAMATINSVENSQEQINQTKSVISKNERSQKVLACLPQNLGEAQQDLQHKVTDNLENLGLAQLDRIFDIRRSPELRDAKRDFVRCLEDRGILPTR